MDDPSNPTNADTEGVPGQPSAPSSSAPTAAQALATPPVLAPQGAASALTFNDLLLRVLTDPKLQCAEKKELLNELRKSGGTDRWTFRTAIWILGAVVLLSIASIWALTWSLGGAEKLPDGLVAIGSGAVGGLAGLLSPGRERDSA